MPYRPPGRSAHQIVPRQLETTLEVDDGIVRVGRARSVRSCVRRLADGPAEACHRSSGRNRGQLLRRPPSGALLDRFRAKPILIIGNLASALDYAGFAFVGRPWQAFICSAVGGAGFGVATTANQVLSLTLVSAEQRASSIALRRVAGNFGLGTGATVAGFIVASANDLRSFQALYLFDGVTFAVFALVVLADPESPRCGCCVGKR